MEIKFTTKEGQFFRMDTEEKYAVANLETGEIAASNDCEPLREWIKGGTEDGTGIEDFLVFGTSRTELGLPELMVIEVAISVADYLGTDDDEIPEEIDRELAFEEASEAIEEANVLATEEIADGFGIEREDIIIYDTKFLETDSPNPTHAFAYFDVTFYLKTTPKCPNCGGDFIDGQYYETDEGKFVCEKCMPWDEKNATPVDDVKTLLENLISELNTYNGTEMLNGYLNPLNDDLKLNERLERLGIPVRFEISQK